MFVSLVMTLLVSAAPGFASNDINSYRWQRNPAFDNKLPASVSTITSFPASRRACAVQCSRQQGCLSFFFNSGSKMCLLQSSTHKPLSSDQQGGGYRYFESGECPKSGGYVIDLTSMTCFRFVLLMKTWMQARALCQEKNESLAVLVPLQKAQFVYNTLASSAYPTAAGYFIGASRPPSHWNQRVTYASQLLFQWETGQTVDMVATRPYWNSIDPDGKGAQNVMAIWYNLRWIDADDFKKRYFICEKPYSRG